MDRPALHIEWREISSLVPYANNARTHSPAQVAAIRRSLREFGPVAPALINGEDGVLAGHGRLLAAQEEGWTHFPCVLVDHLTPEQQRAYILADNRLAEMAGWNMELVSAEMMALEAVGFDVTLTGFDRSLVKMTGTAELEEDAGPGELPEEPTSRVGDMWALGDHLLLCGDCTNSDNMERLAPGGSIDLVVTDPPYNMNYRGTGKGGRRKGILNDHMSADAFRDFLEAAYGAMAGAMKPGASLYAFYKELGTGVFLTALDAAGLTYLQELVWVKNSFVLGGAKYQGQYEPVVFATKGSVGVWNGGRVQSSVLEQIDLMNEAELRAALKALLGAQGSDVLREDKPLKSELHPTMKPVRLLGRLIANSSNPGDTVLDPFGGSGSTLIACQQLGRRCRMAELDPRFADVIVKRWETYTGQEAVRL